MGVNNCVACVETFLECVIGVLDNATTVDEALEGIINCIIDLLNCVFGDDSAQAQSLSQIKILKS